MKFFLIALVVIGLIAIGIFLWPRVSSRIGLQSMTEPTPMPRTVSNTVPENQLSAWIGYWDEEKAVKSLNSTGTRLKTISPMWYRLDKNGEIVWISDVTKKSEIMDVAIKNNISVLPTFTNELDPDKISTLLNDDQKVQKLVEFLGDEAVVNGYRGWDIDFEEMYPGDSGGFGDFVNQLADKLHSKKLLLSVTLQAKTNSKGDREATQAQNWPDLVKNADQIRVMAYDFHDQNSDPGPITPPEDLDKVLKYATSVVPLEKLVVGLPLYGYDWVGEKGESVQYDEALAIANNMNIVPSRDNKSQELEVKYQKDGKAHEMWFADNTSNKVLVNIGRSYGVYQYVYWRLGGEDSMVWK